MGRGSELTLVYEVLRLAGKKRFLSDPNVNVTPVIGKDMQVKRQHWAFVRYACS